MTSEPVWVPLLRAIVRSAPRGKYAIVSRWSPRSGRFVARLAGDLGGARFECDLGDVIAREVCLTGYYEPPVTRLAQRLMKRGGIVVDAGANWGYFSLLAAPAVGGEGKVIALEPDPRQFARLARNLEMNQFANVTALQIAAASRDGMVGLLGYADDAANRGVSRIADTAGAAHRFEVPCTTIDRLTDSCARVDMVKIDVEGAEGDALAGMRDGLAAARYASIVLELHPAVLRERGVDPAECLATLQAHGYTGWSIELGPKAYRSATDPDTPVPHLLRPIDEWKTSAWPHLLWLAPGESLVAHF
jgi:FkbM family methyltransferase